MCLTIVEGLYILEKGSYAISPTVLYSVIMHFILINQQESYQNMFNPETTRVYSLQTFNCHFQFSETDAKHLREKTNVL